MHSASERASPFQDLRSARGGREQAMAALVTVLIVLALLAVLGLALSVRIVKQYEKGVLFRLGRVIGVREPGLTLIMPLIHILRRVSLRIVTMPIQSQGIITRDNVSIDVSAVAYYHVTKSHRGGVRRVHHQDRPVQ
jgi:regulator of protease activity HflC (stomatin/prohibitin superfamily)